MMFPQGLFAFKSFDGMAFALRIIVEPDEH